MANNIQISIDKVMDILTKVKTKLSAPDANSASVIGYIDGQIDMLDAMKPETDITGSRSGWDTDTVLTVPVNKESTTGVVKLELDNAQLNKMIEEMKDATKPNIVYVPQQVNTTPWWQQVTYTATADTKATDKITLGDVPQAKPTIPLFRGADCRA